MAGGLPPRLFGLAGGLLSWREGGGALRGALQGRLNRAWAAGRSLSSAEAEEAARFTEEELLAEEDALLGEAAAALQQRHVSASAASAGGAAHLRFDGGGGGDALQHHSHAHAHAAAEPPPFADLAEADAEAAAVAAEEPPSDGAVQYRDAPLWRTIRAHYDSLGRLMPDYTGRVDLDTFGALYVEQVRREERARQAALEAHRSQVEREARSGRTSRQVGGVLSGVIKTWTQLLEEAVEAEHQEIIAAGQQRGAGSRDPRARDRAAFGPYLLLLSPRDCAALAVHTVLSKVATTVPHRDDAMGAGGSGGGVAVSAPAVLVAEALGSALNDRLKWIRYRAEVAQARQAAKEEAAAFRRLPPEEQAAARWRAQAELRERERRWQEEQTQRQQRRQQQQAARGAAAEGDVPGPRTAESIEAYRADGAAAAAMYQEGAARVRELIKGARLPRAWRQRVEDATQSAGWSMDTRIKVGAALLSLLVENSPVPNPGRGRRGGGGGASGWGARGGWAAAAGGGGGAAAVPAFAYTYRRLEGSVKNQAFVEATPALVHLLNTDGAALAELWAKSPPMLIPPEPWTDYNTGGYLTYRNWMMRTRWSYHVKDELRKRLEQYRPVLDALNVLGGTAWRINRPVYEAMKRLYDARSTAAGLPAQEPLKPPRAPGSHYRLIWEGGCLTARGGPPAPQERRTHRLAADEVRRLNRNMASMHADFRLKWGVATEYLDAPEFYYPHTLDFRGRAYPIHPSLQHLGDDLCRGLLTFAHPRPLGEHGLDWLFVHFANLWGHGEDKRSFDARRRFTRTHLPQLLACAQEPLKNVWWQGAEKPWQALACCFEIAGALASLDPRAYPSSLPVHMDGSCNGLQHYAALGRDEAGGRAVNLLPAEAPQDVYSGVAAIVASRVEADAAAGVPEALRLRGAVDRKLVKQTVMTSVYGVTTIGARAQIEARLRERGALDGDKDLLFKASRYLADHTMAAIGEMFSGAKGIMGWLADCATAVAAYSPAEASAAAAAAADQIGGGGGGGGGEEGAQRGPKARRGDRSGAGSPVRWTTPLGLPVTQPYFRTPTHVVSTVTQSFTISRDDADRDSRVTRARQRSAFPPNYIHSLDSSHMMMTALSCHREGITFAGVHDSFWTHAGTVSQMNRLLREEFVALHTREPGLLAELEAQLRERYPGIQLPPLPPRGGLDVGRVRRSRYFFS